MVFLYLEIEIAPTPVQREKGWHAPDFHPLRDGNLLTPQNGRPACDGDLPVCEVELSNPIFMIAATCGTCVGLCIVANLYYSPCIACAKHFTGIILDAFLTITQKVNIIILPSQIRMTEAKRE